jgi:SAM-dependent methyltransferase
MINLAMLLITCGPMATRGVVADNDRVMPISNLEPGAGLSAIAPDPLRYDSHDGPDAAEVSGLVPRLVPHGARVLDVGCGTGAVSVQIRDVARATVIGVEPSAERAAACRARGIPTIESLFPSESIPKHPSFNAIIFTDVLEHLADPGAALAAAKDYLTTEGLVIASTPNVAHWSVRQDLVFGKFEYKPYGIMDATHLRWFTRRSLRRLFESNGFEVVKLLSAPGVWLPDYRHRRPWKWLPRGLRDRGVRLANRLTPGLFGAQIVVVARVVRR